VRDLSGTGLLDFAALFPLPFAIPRTCRERKKRAKVRERERKSSGGD